MFPALTSPTESFSVDRDLASKLGLIALLFAFQCIFTNTAYLYSSMVSDTLCTNILKYDIQIKDLLLKKNSAVSLNEATSIIGNLDKLPLLHHLMRVCPLPELQFEELFVAVRSLLLKNLDKMEASPELIYFLSTLSLHCFVNEYVYAESVEEICLVEKLADKDPRP